MKSHVEKDTYIVELPSGGVNLETGYDKIPKVGAISAVSGKHAVTQYIHRHNDWKPAIIIHQLKERQNERGGLESLATLVPIVESEDGKRLSARDKEIFTAMALAQELAYKSGSNEPQNYLFKARRLLTEADKNGINF